MSDQVTTCDGCGNAIVTEQYESRPRPYEFAVPGDGDREWVNHSYVLCVECRWEIIDWLDDDNEADIRADISNLDSAIVGMERQAEGWQELADELRELKNGVDDSREDTDVE